MISVLTSLAIIYFPSSSMVFDLHAVKKDWNWREWDLNSFCCPPFAVLFMYDLHCRQLLQFPNHKLIEKQGLSTDNRSLSLLSQATWKKAIEKAKAMPDPWAEFHLEQVETEPCIRYRYLYLSISLWVSGATVQGSLRGYQEYQGFPSKIRKSNFTIILFTRG